MREQAMTPDEALREMRVYNRNKSILVLDQCVEVVEQEREHLRALLTRVLVAEGRCPTRLLIEISRALEENK